MISATQTMSKLYNPGVDMYRSIFLAGLFAISFTAQAGVDELDDYNVVWDTPSEHSGGSMPIGNGDIGLNVWAEANGDVVFYIGKTDAWSDNGRLLKLGRIRMSLTPNPFDSGHFKQTLNLKQGEITIRGGEGDNAVNIRIWVDAHYPVIRLESQSETTFDYRIAFERWRTSPRTITDETEKHSAYGLLGNDDFDIIVQPDSILPAAENRLTWYHRNKKSIYPLTLENQGLGEFVDKYPDPLLHRTFGGCVLSNELHAENDSTMSTETARRSVTSRIYVLTRQTETPQEWLDELENLIENDILSVDAARNAHQTWWRDFWERSKIVVTGPPDAYTMTRGYILQRWINACAGRGNYPIKFNGTLFTVDTRAGGEEGYDADYRRWGGCYWFQNTRLPYWNMLYAGDHDLMRPLFRMYMNATHIQKDAAQKRFGHEGVYFGETMTFWGTYNTNNWGWGNTGTVPTNPWIKRDYNAALELLSMMLDYYDMTRDETFLQDTVLVLATDVFRFFSEHYDRDENGNLHIYPSQALETWHDALNPAPDIAGLWFNLQRLLHLPEAQITPQQRDDWIRLFTELPPLPVERTDKGRVLLPAEEYSDKNNTENPELYAIFPFRLYGLGRTDLPTATLSFLVNDNPGTGGWRQNAIHAACLGRADQAGDFVMDNFTTWDNGSRFPGFFGPNFDWVPDQDHGSVAAIALQRMLLQTRGDKIIVLPAWPMYWDAEFKLHAPQQTIVSGTVRNGELVKYEIVPESRKKDVIIRTPSWPVLPAATDKLTCWQMTTTEPSGSWHDIAYDASAWIEAPGAFGSMDSSRIKILTKWNDTHLWLRKVFYLEKLTPGQIEELVLRTAFACKADIYLNGVLAAAVDGVNAGHKTVAIKKQALDTLQPDGDNVISVECRKNSDVSLFDAGILAAPSGTSIKASIDLGHKYEADSRTPDIENPDEGWDIAEENDDGFYVWNGVLSFSCPQARQRCYFQQQDETDAWCREINPDVPFTLDVKARVTAGEGPLGGLTVQPENGANRFVLCITPDALLFGGSSRPDTLVKDIDNATGFHAYRLTYDPIRAVVRIWRDTTLVGRDLGRFGGSSKTELTIGDENRNSTCEVQIDWLRWEAGGAFAPDPQNTAVENGRPAPHGFLLHANYPNPFNGSTNIQFECPVHAIAKLEIFNIRGRRIKTLIDKPITGGLHEVQWDGTDMNERPVSSGTYFARLQSERKTAFKKILLLK